MIEFCCAFLLAVATTTASDTEAWNEGVEYYRAGDVTNALRVLKPLTLSRTRDYAARAAELVAKLELDAGNREAAAAAAQIALRKHPDDARVNRNFTRATDRLEEAREQARIAAVMKAAEGKDPSALLAAAAADARRLFTASGEYRTNVAERAIALSDQLSGQAEKLADAWLPVKEAIAQAVTNEEQAATILQQLEQAEAKTRQAAKELGDLDATAYSTMSDVEHDFHRFHLLTAMPPDAMGEDVVAQSNAWQDVETFNGRDWQHDALEWTRSFRRQFPAWARAYEQQAQSDTNRPPFTAEDQAKVSALATELEKLQLESCEKVLPANQEKSLKIAQQIRELLPKDKNGGGQQNQQQNQQNQQNQQQDQKQDQQQNQNQDQNQNQNQDQNQQDEQNEQSQPEEQKEGEGEQSEQPEDQEIEAVLQKAQERNDEHEAEKKARMRKAPLPPNERDW